ncbi:MAG: hypothetical protein PVG53_12850, partial [Holophagae bacterium]
RTVLAYHNLSSAYDLIRRFQQGDLARARARELAGGRSAALGVRGRDPRVRYPKLTADDVDAFEDSLSQEARLQLGYGASPLEAFRQLLSPFSVMFWLAALVGVVLLFVRSRSFPEAKECTKCGKVYRLENEPGESPVYCRQCVSVFLQRDLVPIDQQTTKLAQVRRWNRWSNGVRRVVSAVAPGEAMIIGDRVALGLVLAVVAWVGIAGLVVWVPRFLTSIEPTLQVQPVIWLLSLVVLGCWAWSIAGSWRRG